MGALIVVDPDKAKAEILDAIDKAKGNRTHAANAIGATQRNLLRWIAKLDMWPDVDALCQEKGYTVQPGPPRK